MNRNEPSSALVRNGSRSVGLVRAGPLVIWIDVPSSLGSTVAKVVLPRPGGPSKRMCDSGSLSLRQALRTMLSRCTTAFWPMTSRSQRGRRAASRSRLVAAGRAVTIGFACHDSFLAASPKSRSE